MRDPFDKYYMLLVEVKYFNALFDNNPFFDQHAENNFCLKNLSKCSETMIIQKEHYQITPTTKIVIAEKQQKTILNFSLVSLNLVE